jgi:hypothetical protein
MKRRQRRSRPRVVVFFFFGLDALCDESDRFAALPFTYTLISTKCLKTSSLSSLERTMSAYRFSEGEEWLTEEDEFGQSSRLGEAGLSGTGMQRPPKNM